MSKAYAAGGKVGAAGAWVLAKTWNASCVVASSLGDFGAGAIDVGEVQLELHLTADAAKRASKKLETATLIAAVKAKKLAAPAVETPQATPMATA